MLWGIDLRSLHTESDIFVRNVRTLTNKYDLTLCQSDLHIDTHQANFNGFPLLRD